MKEIKWSPDEDDCSYIDINPNPIHQTLEILGCLIHIDLDKNGNIVGIEIIGDNNER